MAQRSSLVKRGKREALVADVRYCIRRGALRPGDRLLSVSELCEHYGVSRRTVALAMAELREGGVIVSRPRRGYFVAESASRAAAAATDQRDHAAADGDLSFFLRPLGPRKTLSLYVSDVYHDSMALWRELVAQHEAAHPDLRIDLLFCRDGHPDAILKRRRVDVIHSTSQVLAEHQDRFPPLTKLESLDFDREDLLPFVRERLERDGRLSGVPMGFTTRYLYVNLDLLAEVHEGPPEFCRARDVFRLALEFERRDAGRGRYGYWPHSLLGFLMQALALELSAAGTWTVHDAALRDALELLHTLRFADLSREPESNPLPLFLEGRLLFCTAYTFQMHDLLPRSRLRWTALPEYLEGTTPLEPYLFVLAVDGETPVPGECVSLVRHLSSRANQERFARLPGLLPVLHSLARDPEFLAAQKPVLAGTIERTLERVSLRGTAQRAWLRDPIRVALRRHLRQELPAERLAAEIREILLRGAGRRECG